MLDTMLMAVAAAGGTAVVQAASTDAWQGFRQAVADWFGRGEAQRATAELERLDQTYAALEAADPSEMARVRIRQEAVWQARFEQRLEMLTADEQLDAAAHLKSVLNSYLPVSGVSSSGGVAAGGDVRIHADHGSVAAAEVHGDVSITNPSAPHPDQG